MKKNKTLQDYLDFFKEADYHYYITGESKYADSYYDKIKDEFEEKFPDHEYKKQIGAEVKSDKKVALENQMGSQKKIYTKNELIDFVQSSFDKVQNNDLLFISDKLDGLSMSLKYINGKLVQGATRGDGKFGEDVTSNIKLIKTIPHLLSESVNCNVRGEVILSLSKLVEINKEKEKNGDEKLIKNCRNGAVGIIGRDDGVNSNQLTFFAYDISGGTLFHSEKEKFEYLIKLGFIVPRYYLCKNPDEVQSLWEQYESHLRNEYDYETDGLIVSLNTKANQDVLGIIDNRPRYSRAYKFTAQVVQTEILDIVWEVGRTGRITPVAELRPVPIAGVTVSNVTLHNLSQIVKNNISIGDTIEIQRSGDVIPKFNRVLNSTGLKKINKPIKCPACGGAVSEDKTFLLCKNEKCSGRAYENLLHWITTVEVQGFGAKLVSQLCKAGLVKNIIDFYQLQESDIAILERRGDKTAKKVLKELHDKKEIALNIFIKALGVVNFSANSVDLIEAKYPTIESLFLATKEELIAIHGIGDAVADAILSIKNRKEEIEELLTVISIKKKQSLSNKFSKTSVCFTGVRDKNLEMIITQNGGKITNSISRDLTYLVAKDPTGSSSKLDKAKSLGVKIISLTEASKIFIK
jgi:DNA ligase (NAD+)